MSLSGDKAYELFMSSEPFPILTFLDDWKDGKIDALSGYVCAVVLAYSRMTRECHDGRYGGKIRQPM